jgi:hypothetical protein
MAVLIEQQIAEKALKRESFRISNVSSKLTLRETKKLDELATKRGKSRGEFIRQLILAALESQSEQSSASTELTEIMGIRLMLTNLFRPLATGQKLTPEAFDNMVAEVKKRKRSVAEDALQDLERA